MRRHFVFPSTLFGPDIIAQSEKNRGAQARLLGPADETHVCDQLGPGPTGLLVGFGDFVERALVDSELLQLPHEQFAHLLVHSGTDMPYETKRFAPVKAQQQRAEMSTAAAGRGPAAHDDVQGLRGLQLHPIVAARAGIKTLDTLSNNSLEILLPGYLKEFFAAFQLMIGKAKFTAGIQDATKKSFALEQGNFPQIVSIDIE